MKKSKWFFWSFLPFFNFAAWIHAAIRTGRDSYYWIAAIYSLPLTIAVVLSAMQADLGLSKEAADRLNDLGSTAAALFWVAGMMHVLLKKDSVDAHIQAYDEGRMQTGRAVSNSPSQAPVTPTRGQKVDFNVAGRRAVDVLRDSPEAFPESQGGKRQAVLAPTEEGGRASRLATEIGNLSNTGFGWAIALLLFFVSGIVALDAIATTEEQSSVGHNWLILVSTVAMLVSYGYAYAKGPPIVKRFLAGVFKLVGVIIVAFFVALVAALARQHREDKIRREEAIRIDEWKKRL